MLRISRSTRTDRPAFDVYHNGEFLVSIKLSVGGEHNILNALAVAAAADFFGIDPAAIKEGLEEFVARSGDSRNSARLTGWT